MNARRTDGDAMERLLTAFAFGVAFCIALILPAVHFFVAHKSLQAVLQTEADINARLATEIVNANPELWTVEAERLGALIDRRPPDRTPEIRQVLGTNGETVADSRVDLAEPIVWSEATVFDSGRAVGKFRITRSMRPLLIDTAWTALVALALAISAYLAVKLLPLRALAAAHRKLRQLASYDGLTGLPNRALFADRLRQAQTRSKRDGVGLALLLVDIDRFKDVNDSLGHAFGDRLLQHVAATITGSLRSTDTVATGVGQGEPSLSRLGGDEFTVILEGVSGPNGAALVAERVLRALDGPFAHEGREIFVSASIGITLYPHDDVACDELVGHAEAAMYRSKEKGRNSYTFYSADLNGALEARMTALAELHHAVPNRQFVLHFQPKATLDGGRITGVEALIRWQHPVRGLVPPDQFIPLLEETGLIMPVGDWVIHSACRALAAWDRQGLPALTVAVNLSARQLRSPSLLGTIRHALAESDIAPHRLELELTESMLVEDNETSRTLLAGLKELGLPVAIDDFGTGQSALVYLKRFRIDVLKIDRSFVRDLPRDAEDRAIAEAIVALAKSLKMQVVAEGVETVEQAEFLRRIGCDSMQGYLLSKPLPENEFIEWIRLAHHVTGDADR